MAMLLRVLFFLVIFAAAYLLVQRARAGRDAKFRQEIVRLARSKGGVDLVDVCRALGVRPTYAEALLEWLVNKGHLAEQVMGDGGRRYIIPPELTPKTFPPSDTVH